MAKPMAYGEFLRWFFGEHENAVVYSASDPEYTHLQKGLLDSFLLCLERNADGETRELRAIVSNQEQLFLVPPHFDRCEGLYAFHLGPKPGAKLGTESKKLLEAVFTNFPDAKAAGILMIHDDAVSDPAASTKGKKALDTLLDSIRQPEAKKKTTAKK